MAEASEQDRVSAEFAQATLTQVNQIYLEQGTENATIRAAAVDELAGLAEDGKGTVFPVSADNPAYQVEHSIDRTQFLQTQLQGKVLDIGAGEADELAGIVPDDRVEYFDQIAVPGHTQGDARRMPYPDGSFDSVYSRNCLQLDPEHLVPEALRVLNEQRGTMVIAISVAQLTDAKSGLISTLSALQKNGIDIGKQCSLTTNKTTLTHERVGIQQTQPEILLTVQRGVPSAPAQH